MYTKTKYELKHFLYPIIISATFMLQGCSVVPEVGGNIAEPVGNPQPIPVAPPLNTAPQNIQPPVTTQTPRPIAPPPKVARNTATLAQANTLIRQGKRREAAETYFQASRNHPSPKRERIILQAAEIAAGASDSRTVNRYLSQIPNHALQGENGIRHSYVKALLALQLNNPKMALSLLPPTNIQVSSGLRAKLEHVRKKALAQSRPVATTSPLPQTPAAPPAPALPAATNKLAILLPKSGRLSSVGNEIFKGIKHAQAKVGGNTRSKLYDVSQGGALAQYKLAVSEGADMIVGPLDKAAIAQLLSNAHELSKPILALNYVDQSTPASLYQFGLSPDDEATQVAEFALRRGQKNALVMVPNSKWGQRLEAAFTNAYRSRGGQVLHVARYSNAPAGYLNQVQAALQATQGKAQMVFLAASPSQARLMRPLLQAQASLLPVYATSHIFSGQPNPSKDNDLDGIIYTEIPWVLETQKAGRLGSSKYPRMFALGIDAFVIAKNLNKLARSNSVLRGKTGQTRLLPNRRIQRRLDFATFINGRPSPLGQ